MEKLIKVADIFVCDPDARNDLMKTLVNCGFIIAVEEGDIGGNAFEILKEN